LGARTFSKGANKTLPLIRPMIGKKTAVTLGKIARSPLFSKGVSVAKKVAEVGAALDVPLSGALAKGLGVAEKVLSAI